MLLLPQPFLQQFYGHILYNDVTVNLPAIYLLHDADPFLANPDLRFSKLPTPFWSATQDFTTCKFVQIFKVSTLIQYMVGKIAPRFLTFLSVDSCHPSLCRGAIHSFRLALWSAHLGGFQGSCFTLVKTGFLQSS